VVRLTIAMLNEHEHGGSGELGNSNPSITDSYLRYSSCCPFHFIAVIASYTALDLAGRVTAAQGGERAMVSWRCHCYGSWHLVDALHCDAGLPIPMAYDFQPSSSQWQWQSLLPGSSVRSQPSEMSCLQLLTGVCSWACYCTLPYYMAMAAMEATPGMTQS